MVLTTQGELEEEDRRMKQAVENFVKGATAGDNLQMRQPFQLLFRFGLWKSAFQAIACAGDVPLNAKHSFEDFYYRNGELLREEIDDDAVLADGLRTLLVPYRGRRMRLFRGEMRLNLSRQTYGVSWTSSRRVAEGFARGKRCAEGGSVMLSAYLGVPAIISAIGRKPGEMNEYEYVVDPSLVEDAVVIAGYPEEALSISASPGNDAA